jgi:hypothetical protein
MTNYTTTEPSSIIAGDTLIWLKTLTNYPASAGWTLKYRAINSADNIDIISAASGADHLISVPAAVSADYAPGEYQWQSYVTNIAGERYTIETGSIVVKANWAAQVGGLDIRSNAKKILDTLETAWVTASATRAFVFEYQIGERKMRFATRSEWIAEMDYWRREVAREKRAEKLAAGLGSGRKVYMRF